MKKTTICVRGQPDSGKTTAITLAYNELAKKGVSVYSNPRYDATELKEVLEVDDVRVGFVSAGDKPDRLDRSLYFLLDYDCVVIVCAARLDRSGEPHHKTIEVVEQFCGENRFDLHWIHKPRDRKGREAANRGVADEIIARVRKSVEVFTPVGGRL